MIADAETFDRSRFSRDFDACIVGAGPAGITLARRLAARGHEVALMEGGGLAFSDRSQDLYRGETAGMAYAPLDAARLRYLGGTSNHWGGACRELDPYDFLPQPHLAFSGWPIAKGDLDPYQAEANAILDLKPPAGFPDQPLEQDGHAFRKIDYRFSRPPTRFGEKYRAELAASASIHLVLNANLVDLRLDPSHGAVTEAVFRTYDPADPGFPVRARLFCLCAGGIENPRILLNARSQLPEGLGNRHGLVGRFFCEHPYFRLGDVLFEAPFYGLEHYAPTPEFITERRIVNFNMHLQTTRPRPPLSLPREVAREVACLAPFTARLAERVLGHNPRCDAEGLGLEGYFARRRMPEDLEGIVHLQTGQGAAPENRVRLDDARDRFGLNRIALDWSLSDVDRRTVRVAVLRFGMHLAGQGIGRIRVRDWLLDDDWEAGVAAGDIAQSYHHMCTTRMSDDPRRGVVDRNCRVHGISNLYVGGSSVFSTTGHATPTYTIVQLALRLGDHLADRSPA